MTHDDLIGLYRECLYAAQRTGDRAYIYAYAGDQLVEVRVWPDGTATLTEVDAQGTPTGEPAPLEV